MRLDVPGDRFRAISPEKPVQKAVGRRAKPIPAIGKTQKTTEIPRLIPKNGRLSTAP
jgi:hypothetical protein